jgi:outer membrane lipoprotein-sorting protein
MFRVALIAPFALLGSAALAQSTDLALVSAHLKSVATMTAGFAQTNRAGKTVSGFLTLKRPGRIRFQYEKGIPLLVVSDGRALTFVDYSVKQVQQWPVGNSPLGVLLDPNKDLGRFAKIISTDDPRLVVVEAKDAKHAEYGTLTLAFVRQGSAPGGLMLQGWVALDGQGNRTSVRLSNQMFNVPVSDRAFQWRDPRPNVKGH